MARYECVRCHVVYHDSDGPHLCKDLKTRFERQEKAHGVIRGIIEIGIAGGFYPSEMASDILTALSGRDLGFG